MIGFKDLNIDILYLSTQLNNKGHHENELILNNIMLLLIGIWPRKPQLSYTGALVWTTLLCLHPFPNLLYVFLSMFRRELVGASSYWYTYGQLNVLIIS